ncbi:amidohydrolase family protein [Flavobacterium aurantiibacter]|uniref:Amidohydrolase n=1 Tax=Flavobacterium aurantiibacter TaxID=2023067 RepID=A0A256A445_9FLAO|nr:amidohydrolase family protein [Flavobacterium aurantiibacter]OYQ48442.1 amidohydrolase [Flavobacterium aurantiibacter]
MFKKLKVLLLFLPVALHGQIYFPNNESTQVQTTKNQAFTNCKVYTGNGQLLENATILVSDGIIKAVGQNLSVPKNYLVEDLQGLSVYPSFIDIYSNFGISKPNSNYRNSPVYDLPAKGFYWNDNIKAHQQAVSLFNFDSERAESFLKNGFSTVVTHQRDGIVRGTGAAISLLLENSAKRILNPKSATFYSFDRSVAAIQSYPSSLMGSIALLRQFYNDAIWAKNNGIQDADLQAFNEQLSLPKIFEVRDHQSALRALKLHQEFGFQTIVKTSGTDYLILDDLKKTQSAVITSLAFPEAYDVSDANLANQIDFSDLLYWNQAPANAASLAKNNIPFAFTLADLKKTDEFRANVQKAILYGLSPDKALEALTTTPAKLVGLDSKMGSIAVGKQANFIVANGPLFTPETVWYETYTQGVPYVLADRKQIDIRGTYKLSMNNQEFTVKITGTTAAAQSEVTDLAGVKYNSKLSYSRDRLQLLLKPADSLTTNFNRLSANVVNAENIAGTAVLLDNKTVPFTLQKTAAAEKATPEKAPKPYEVLPARFPNGAYGLANKATKEDLLFKNATVWTNEKEGILVQTDVLVSNGKIKAVGKNLAAGTAKVIDATGKHLTSGIIDEHSHIAISSGVNEAGHNSSAEVSIQDVVDATDLNIYLNLSGGVTTSQLLHGSANPIGGKSAIIKLKWGENAANLLFPNQPGFIKFALGENVKQSNWGIQNPSRYPQSRMGVEQTFAYYFDKAVAYKKEWADYRASKSKGLAPRKDAELETLVEILDGKRFITCHSYVQSEILMLMNLAEKYNFRVNTFTHILEGYKVADEMKKHGAAASTFSDWWAYKFEVNDAIPYNGALMHKQGVLVGFNSDDAEMSRRLNQEAAKAVKYGGVSEEDAWKFVTLNPAKMLHIDDRVGSIKVGKDADLVLWSENPLSVYAKAEKTLIDGTIYFDREQAEKLRLQMHADKGKIFSQLLEEKNKGMITIPPKKTEPKHYHCDTLEP